MEHDSSVAEYFDQPPPIKLVYAIPRGRQMGVLHTPDFFVIRDHEAGWEEWKTEEELQHLNARNPHRYLPKPKAQGGWDCPPGAAYAAPWDSTTEFDLQQRSIGRSNATFSFWTTTCVPIHPSSPQAAAKRRAHKFRPSRAFISINSCKGLQWVSAPWSLSLQRLVVGVSMMHGNGESLITVTEVSHWFYQCDSKRFDR